MDTRIVENKTNLRIKFVAFYLLSIALIFFIIFYLLPNNTTLNPVVTASPIATTNDLQDEDILGKIEILNKEYQTLKSLDRDFADGKADSQNKDMVAAYIGNITSAENSINNTLDSIARIARASNSAQSLKLQTFVESYRLTLADRSAMNAYKTAMLSSGNATSNQKAILQLQTDLASKNTLISSLQTELQSLKNNTAKKTPITATPANQQKSADLTATIAAQEKRIASLTADLAAAEKEKNSIDAASKKGADNSTSLKSQNTLLEQRVSQLSADLKLAQADCNITRADASQIISNSKQRKNLLSEALSILNGLALSTDASVKNKVAEKVSYLNKVAANMHD